MFYLKELYLRFYFFLFSFFTVSVVLWIYKKNLLTILTFSLLNILVSAGGNVFEHLIYTNPAEVFSIYLSLVLYFSLLLTVPYLVWHFLDFLRSSFYFSEYFNIKRIFTQIFVFVFIINLIGVLIIFPYVWFFFNAFNLQNESTSILTFSLELRVQEYFNFFFTFLYLINLSSFLMLTIILILSFLNLQQKLYWKKLFTFFNVVFATLLSPPDVFSQLIFLFILSILFEFILFFSIVKLKVNKYS
jgi:Sec-independent protein secretion pathway component TatC